MDVVVVVIIVVDSCSGIFVLFKCIGFYLLVFLYFEYVVELFVGVMVVINGNEQQWLELEFVVCQYEENLLLLFYDMLMQYVEMGNSIFVCSGY